MPRRAEGRGSGRPDGVVTRLASRMLVLGGVETDDAGGRARACESALDSGRALERSRRMIERQGGDPRVVDDYSRLPHGAGSRASSARRAVGFVTRDARRGARPRQQCARRRPLDGGRPGRPRRRRRAAREARRSRWTKGDAAARDCTTATAVASRARSALCGGGHADRGRAAAAAREGAWRRSDERQRALDGRPAAAGPPGVDPRRVHRPRRAGVVAAVAIGVGLCRRGRASSRIAGLALILGARLLLLLGAARDRLPDRGVGPDAAVRLRADRAQDRPPAGRRSRRPARSSRASSTSRSSARRSCSARSAIARSGRGS